MKILNKEDARVLLDGRSLDGFVTGLYELPILEGTYSTPVRSGMQIALARLLAYLFLRESAPCLYVRNWGIANEHMDLFRGYRSSLGERRSLIEAPVHVFDTVDDDAFISLMCMVLFFSWDASVFDLAGTSLAQTSHDGWLELRSVNRVFQEELGAQLATYRTPLLSPWLNADGRTASAASSDV